MNDDSLDAYRFDLPEELIAQAPAERRDASRLMVVDKGRGVACEVPFRELGGVLPPGALLVANNSRVLPARIVAAKPTGGLLEFLLLTPLPLIEPRPATQADVRADLAGAAQTLADLAGTAQTRADLAGTAMARGADEGHPAGWAGQSEAVEQAGGSGQAEAVEPAGRSGKAKAVEPPDGDWREAEVRCLLRSSKKARPGQRFELAPELSLTVLERGDFGLSQVRLRWRGELADIFERHGHMPLPPYIRRPDSQADRERYQTLHARPDRQGSVAAPTAGLHFTPELRHNLAGQGFGWAEVSLHVGYGTFSPVRAQDIREHAMHAEHLEVPPETAEAVLAAKAQGRPVIAVGTTSARALEGMHAALGRVAPFAGTTDIFIRPGRPFAVVDGMLTNFHLPGSSLVIMVSALAGRRVVLDAYAQAVARRFRFFSYGDAMLIR